MTTCRAGSRLIKSTAWALKHEHDRWAYSERGNAVKCAAGSGGRAEGHMTGWAADPPHSPVPADALVGGEASEVVLLPYGATDVRLAELPTTAV